MLNVYELDNLGAIIDTFSNGLSQTLSCAYDPNDKIVTPQGLGIHGYISNNQELEYLIRFQNTGNDTAITVMVRDQLDPNLDWSTIQPIASSHPMQVWVEQDGEAVFKFENIMLPDSNVNELASHGFIKFRINMEPSLSPETQIFNEGHIYFDYNPAVITNKVLNTNSCNISVYQTRFDNQIIIASSLDNLIKGAAGQAVQNFNIRFGFKETLSLG